MLTYSRNASLDARLIVADMFALSPTRDQVGLLVIMVTLVVEAGLAEGEELMEFRQTQGMMDA